MKQGGPFLEQGRTYVLLLYHRYGWTTLKVNICINERVWKCSCDSCDRGFERSAALQSPIGIFLYAELPAHGVSWWGFTSFELTRCCPLWSLYHRYLALYFMAYVACPDKVIFISDPASVTNEFDISHLFCMQWSALWPKLSESYVPPLRPRMERFFYYS